MREQASEAAPNEISPVVREKYFEAKDTNRGSVTNGLRDSPRCGWRIVISPMIPQDSNPM
jgi:hypothetical protein